MTRRVVILAAIVLATVASVAETAGKAGTADTAGKKPVAAAKPATNKEAVRTLDAIRIEGEIDVPQVLFITARDYRRFRDAAPVKYQITSAGIAKSIPLPNRVRMVAPIE